MNVAKNKKLGCEPINKHFSNQSFIVNTFNQSLDLSQYISIEKASTSAINANNSIVDALNGEPTKGTQIVIQGQDFPQNSFGFTRFSG